MKTTISSNRDLQATHQIISILEKSKANGDKALDDLPGIYVVIKRDGSILLGNEVICRLLNIDSEAILEKNLANLFLKSTWNDFQTMIRKLDSKKSEGRVSFELPVDAFSEMGIEFLWQISSYDNNNKNDLICAFGKDISELRKAERKMAEIFLNIPLGILSIHEDGFIEGGYSSYSEWLIGSFDLANKSIRDVLFEPCFEFMTPEEIDGVGLFMSSLGKPDSVFEDNRGLFPREIYFPPEKRTGEGAYLALSYQPLSYNGVVKRALVMIEDKTEFMESKKLAEKEKGLEEAHIGRIIQVKKCSPEMFVLYQTEIDPLVERICEDIDRRDYDGLLRTLHGIKGNARVAGFKELVTLSHDLEEYFRDRGGNLDKIDWNQVQEDRKKIELDWSEIKDIARALFKLDSGEGSKGSSEATAENKRLAEKGHILRQMLTRYNAIFGSGMNSIKAVDVDRISLAMTVLNVVGVGDMGELLKARASNAAKELGKKINFEFFYTESVHVIPEVKAALSEILLHLLTNAVAHGIETPDIRIANGKDPVGKIKVKLVMSLGSLVGEVTDDGAGLDIEKIQKKAIKKQLVALNKAINLNKKQIIDFIFMPGFSTTEQIDEISGRGVGLDAVKTLVEKHGGSINASPNDGAGSKFFFDMMATNTVEIKQRCLWIHDFLNMIQQNIDGLNSKKVFEIDVAHRMLESSNLKGVYFGDTPKVALALTTFFANFSLGHKVSLELADPGNNQLLFVLTRKKDPRFEGKTLDYEFGCVEALCNDYITDHGGVVQVEGDMATIHVGHILFGTSLPNIRVDDKAYSSNSKFQETIKTLEALVDEMNIHLKFGEIVNDEEIKLLLSDSAAEIEGRGVTYLALPSVMRAQLLRVIENSLGIK